MAYAEQVFVYGTLRPTRDGVPLDDTCYYSQIVQYVQAATPAKLLAGALYDLGAYPGVTPGNGVVYGDLLTVSLPAMEIMDRIEGHPNFYQRAKVDVETENGLVRAWIYWTPKGMVLGRLRITNGDWLKRAESDSVPEPDRANAGNVDETLQALINRFAESDCCWISTVRPAGRVHSSPIWHVWYQGRAYIVTLSTAVKTKNIAKNPSVTITHPDPINPIIIEGWATPTPGLQAQLQPLFQSKFNWDISTDSQYDTIIEITPLKMMAWGKYGEGKWLGEAIVQI